jgi:hypothetical protein
MVLFMYSDYTITVDPHTIIIISVIVWLYFMWSLQIHLYFLYSILRIDICIILFTLFVGLL